MVAVIIFFWLVIHPSCTSDDCMTGEMPVLTLEELGCPNTLYQMQVFTDSEFVIISSQEDFNETISISCEPDIDWNEFDMIAGMKGLTQGVSAVDHSLVKNCQSNQLTLYITFRLNETLTAPIVSFHALIPKLSDEEHIVVKITTQS